MASYKAGFALLLRFCALETLLSRTFQLKKKNADLSDEGNLHLYHNIAVVNLNHLLYQVVQ